MLDAHAVTFDGAPALLLYVQSAQINAIAPWEIAGKSQAQLWVSYGGNSNCTTARVSQASPGFFQYPGADNILHPAAVNQDGTLNSLHPAPVGSIVTLYMTGLGMLSPLPTAGSVIQPPLPILASKVRVDFCGSISTAAR